MKKFFTMKKRDAKGFTLVELMIVVAIIGILAAIAIPQFAQYRMRGYVSTINSDVKNAFTALAAMVADDTALNVASVTPAMLKDAGFTQSPGVETDFNHKTNWNDYMLKSTGSASWGLGKNTAEMAQDGVLKPASIKSGS